MSESVDLAIPTSDDDPFQVAPEYASLFDDLPEKQYLSLKASIRKHGVDTPIIIDSENNVIDGHHRLRAVRELRAEGHDISDIPYVQKPTRLDTLRARRANLARRDGHKKAGVQDYLREHLSEPPDAAETDAEAMWPDDDDVWTQQGVAHELGVSQYTVNKAIEDSTHIIGSNTLSIPTETDKKREAVRSCIEENPHMTDSEVAESVDWDISQQTVNRWRNKWFSDDTDEEKDVEQSSILGAGDDAEDTSGIAQDAADGEQTATEAVTDEGTATSETVTETRKKKQKQEEIEEDEQRREEQRESFAEAVAESGAATVTHGDFVEVLSEYGSESIDHIITDPPYNEDALPVWEGLGRVAARVLKPGGFLAAYTGQYLLPDVLDRLRNHLTYYWQFVTLDDQPTFFIKKRIGIRYKPVVVFAKPPLDELDKQAHDVIDAGDRSKENHKWEQPTEKAAEIITALSEPDELICDPMCGSGTTGVAALNNHRRTLLIDRDEEAVKTTNRRISGVLADD